MKSLILATIVLAGFSAFATAPKCFKAQNPETMSVEIAGADESVPVETEGVASATLKLSFRQDADVSVMRVKTSTGKRVVVEAYRTSGDPQKAGAETFMVECDGGSMDVIPAADDQVVVKSDRIRGDIEGCDGTATVKTAGTTFNQVQCK